MKIIKTSIAAVTLAGLVILSSCEKKCRHRPLPPKPKHECTHSPEENPTETSDAEEVIG